VARAAETARLKLTPEEEQEMARRLEGMRAMLAALEAVDTTGVEPQVDGLPDLPEGEAASLAPRREDEVGESLPQEQVLANAPSVQDGFFKVPRVVEE